MSETTGLGASNPLDDIRIGTVGRAPDNVQLKLGEDGELLVKGDVVTPGYRNLPEKNAETIVEGWLHTGDIATIDDDGYVTIIDRKKELIINSAGKNMSPAVQAGNSRLSRVEQIKKYTVLAEEWLPAGDELTPTMKLRRRPIERKYREQIDAMYA